MTLLRQQLQRLQGEADAQARRMGEEAAAKEQLQGQLQQLQAAQAAHEQQLAAARHAVATALEGQLAAESRVQEVGAQLTAERLVRRQLQGRVGELRTALRRQQAGRSQRGGRTAGQAPTAQHQPARGVHASVQEREVSKLFCIPFPNLGVRKWRDCEVMVDGRLWCAQLHTVLHRWCGTIIAEALLGSAVLYYRLLHEHAGTGDI